MFVSVIFAEACQISGMAKNRLLPAILARRNGNQVSHFSVLILLILTLPLVNIDYNDLLPMTNTFSAGVDLAIIASAYDLRNKLPYIPRPAKTPGAKTCS
uniref:Uncharacterized protein n=1 Tax=Globisporangium ultimum (strain ATCC 200006 / CBS 805.95 / DAOM BR144) TaxID=431595 RepID=K3WXD0_GLOUD